MSDILKNFFILKLLYLLTLLPYGILILLFIRAVKMKVCHLITFNGLETYG